ncbi:SMC-Scp complex subunit ScpB [Phyllobacterium phragmitis]|uniref:SMC-Scp complex subunit ScpB n=1 Tax=Phyllobacterium phragmitis TaxID=2670329 RepID=UPI003CCA5043
MAAPGDDPGPTRRTEIRNMTCCSIGGLEDLPAELRWREWILRVEAIIFASTEPVARETLARVVGRDCSIDLLIDDLQEELRDRSYAFASVADGWQHRTQNRFADTIRASSAPPCSTAARDAQKLKTTNSLQPVERYDWLYATGH